MVLSLLLAVPPITALVCRLLYRTRRVVEVVNALGALATAALALAVAANVARHGARQFAGGVFYVDALSAVMLAVVGVVGGTAALVSIAYIRHDLGERRIPDGRRGVGWYYLGLHMFLWTMLVTVCLNNLGLLWVGIEATTLASALLVGFYRTKAALEAAWKYIILCTVGITVALFGVLLTYYASLQAAGSGAASLNWTALSQSAHGLDPTMMRLAFVFVLVGFGTKAGFAPLHTWLADAHSQAPSPISAMLSAVLLPCALYGILRFHAITAAATGTAFSSNLLLAFGLLSVVLAVPFIVIQRDLKRLLAYSSVEHIGLMAVAFGIGGPFGIYAGILHLVNHAVTKALLFFTAGEIGQRFGTRRISAIRGVIQTTPLIGWLLLLGVLAITGSPPSGIFVSELTIAGAGLAGNPVQVGASVMVVLLLGVVFAGMLFHALRLIYGSPGRMAEPVASAGARRSSELAWVAPLVPLLLMLVVFGIVIPAPVSRLFQDVATALSPVAQSALR